MHLGLTIKIELTLIHNIIGGKGGGEMQRCRDLLQLKSQICLSITKYFCLNPNLPEAYSDLGDIFQTTAFTNPKPLTFASHSTMLEKLACLVHFHPALLKKVNQTSQLHCVNSSIYCTCKY